MLGFSAFLGERRHRLRGAFWVLAPFSLKDAPP